MNDAPTLASSGGDTGLGTITEDDVDNNGRSVGELLGVGTSDAIFEDVDSDPAGIAVFTSTPRDGRFEYSLDGGVTWEALGAVDNNNARLLSASDRLRYVPDGVAGGNANLGFRAWDGTQGNAGELGDTIPNGGSSAFSNQTRSSVVFFTDVNDAPVLDNTGDVSLNTQAEDAGAPTGAVGTLISDLVSLDAGSGNVTDVDNGATTGVAITGADTTNGTYFFTTNGGSTWVALGGVSDISARVLRADSNTRIYFQSNGDYNGTVEEAITFRAWDQTQGDNGTQQDASTNGGTTAFSSDTETADLTITAVNDAPVAANIENTDAAYVENAAPVQVTNAITFSDVDDTDLESATVQITGGFVSTEDVLAFTSQFDINGTYNDVTGILALSGSATLAEYQTVIRSVTYANTSDNPNTADRTVSFTVNDGDLDSNTQTRDITIEAVNDDPTNAGTLPSDITVTEDVASDVDLSAVDFTDVDAGSGDLTVTLSTATGGQLTASTDGGVTVGGTATALTFTGSQADLDAYFDVAANIQYVHGTPNTNGNDADTITVVINDNGNTGTGGGADQALGTVNVDITADNDEEVLATNAGATVAEGSTGNVIASTQLQTTDADNTNAELVYTLNAVPVNGTLRLSGTALAANDTFTQADIDAGRLTYDHDGSETSSDLFDFTVDDGAGTTTPGTFNFTVTPVNDAPVVTSPVSAYSFTEQGSLAIQGTGFSISDADDNGNALTAVFTVGEGRVLIDPTGSGVTVSAGNSTDTVTFSGTKDQINSLLDGSFGTITYRNDQTVASDTPSASTTLTLTVNDQGNTGSDPGTSGNATSEEGFATQAINITSVNDAPTFLGSELITNGDLASGDLTGFTTTGSVNIRNEQIRFGENNAPGENSVSQTINTVAGEIYNLTFNYSDFGGAQQRNQALEVAVNSSASNLLTTETILSDTQDNVFVSYSFTFTADSSSATVTFTDTSDSADSTSNDTTSVDGRLDKISVKQTGGLLSVVGYAEDNPAVVLDSERDVV